MSPPKSASAPDGSPGESNAEQKQTARASSGSRRKSLSRRSARDGLKQLREQTPSWVTSLLLHVAVLFLLAYVTLPLSSPPELSLKAAQISEEKFELEEELLDVELELEEDTLEETVDEQLEVEPQIEVSAETLEFQDAAPLEMIAEEVDFGATIDDFGEVASTEGMTSSGLAGRSGPTKSELLRSGGGTRSSEKAVQAGLDWLARHQYPDGSWNFDHTQSECDGRCGEPGSAIKARAGATGLALMAYLGAGHTQNDGRYKTVVLNGIYALGTMVKLSKNGGSFHEPQGSMYSHGIATMAICEAYALTGDPALREPAQAAINFVCYAQDPNGGGWRYSPRQPGDTSVMGWQIGALKSGYLSNLYVPSQVVARAAGFLDSVMVNDGARYLYTAEAADGHHACTAIGALCRMYMGSKKEDPGIKAAIQSLSDRGPSRADAYYNYYAAQTLFHYTGGKGPMWKKWNDKMRTQLVETQVQEGHATGSWAPSKNHSAEKGGRLFTTAMSTMTLEVYYRMLPIYREKAVAGEFEFQEK
ncbi:MAG: hypothetical protein AAGD11_19835 [Planctomycetota bacterium]